MPLTDGDDADVWVECITCAGDGTVHDCGEDTCPCANPDEDDQVACVDCCGHGGWWE